MIVSLNFDFSFFFNDTATTEIYTLSLHDALPIFSGRVQQTYKHSVPRFFVPEKQRKDRKSGSAGMPRPISYAVFCLKKKKNPPFAQMISHLFSNSDGQHRAGILNHLLSAAGPSAA